MIEKNSFCDQPGCSQPAYVFGLQSTKKRVCRDHVLALLDKQVPVFDIAAFDYIQTAEDWPVYLHRKDTAHRGLGHISILEAGCHQTLQETQEQLVSSKALVLGAVSNAFQSLQTKVLQQFEKAKETLRGKRDTLGKYLADREYQLSLEDAALCDQTPSGPLFRARMKDCGGPVEEAIKAQFELLSIPQMTSEGPGSGLTTRVGRGKSWFSMLIPIALVFLAHILFWPQTLDLQGISAEYVELSRSAREVGNYTLALTRLNEGRALVQDFESVEFDLELGTVLSHFGNRVEAIRVLQKGLDLQMSIDSFAELAIRLKNEMAEVYFQAGQWTDVVDTCNSVFQVWGGGEHSFELLRSLYFLSSAQYWLQRHSQGYEVVDYWKSKLVVSEPRSSGMLLFVLAEKMYVKGKRIEAASHYQQALELSEDWPDSYIVASAMHDLGTIWKLNQQLNLAEQQYSKATELLDAHFPLSMEFANCRLDQGLVYSTLGRKNEAAQCLEEAYQVYRRNSDSF